MGHQEKGKPKTFKAANLAPEKHVEYLANKRKGGANFQKGFTFENRFAVGKLAEQLDAYLSGATDVEIRGPMPDFYVDDLVVQHGTCTESAWQLKNVSSLSWGGEKGTVGFDFYHQLQACKGKDKQRLELVVPSEKLKSKMEGSKPKELDTCTVSYFPDSDLLGLICSGHLFPALQNIARSSRPSKALLNEIARLLLARWCDSNGRLTTSHLIPLSTYPSLLRTKLPNELAKALLKPEVAEILDKIPDFRYEIDRGFFHCDYCHTEMTLNFDCFSPKFEIAQKWILENRPAVFDGAFEDQLTMWSETI